MKYAIVLTLPPLDEDKVLGALLTHMECSGLPWLFEVTKLPMALRVVFLRGLKEDTNAIAVRAGRSVEGEVSDYDLAAVLGRELEGVPSTLVGHYLRQALQYALVVREPGRGTHLCPECNSSSLKVQCTTTAQLVPGTNGKAYALGGPIFWGDPETMTCDVCKHRDSAVHFLTKMGKTEADA